MRCPVCAQDNPETNWFCSKCLASLRQTSLKRQKGRRVYLFADNTETYLQRRPKPKRRTGGATIVIIVALGILYLLYG